MRTLNGTIRTGAGILAKKRYIARLNNLKEFYALKIKDVMDLRYWDLPCVGKDDNIRHVLSILRSQYHVWVVEDLKSMNLCGVITEHDVLDILAPKSTPTHIFSLGDVHRWSQRYMDSISGFMCRMLITCTPKDTVRKVLIKMKKHGVRRLPVVEKGKIVGEVSFHALLNKYYDIIQ